MKKNVQVVEAICAQLDSCRPRANELSYCKLIEYVPDRLGHDKRYAIDASKIKKELDWQTREGFDSRLSKTIIWYLKNMWWLKSLRTVK